MRIEGAKFLKSGEEQDFSFVAPVAAFDINSDGAEDVSFEGEVRIEGKVGFTGEVYRVEGEIAVTKNFNCDRCLVPVKREEIYALREDFADTVRDDAFLLAASGDIELYDAVRETIIAAQPAANYCRDDCLGLCRVCGKNLNDGDCGCDRQVIDPRLAVLGDFFSEKR